MSEKVYKSMKSVGVTNLVFGILTIVAGIATGVVLIVGGGKLLKNKGDVMF